MGEGQDRQRIAVLNDEFRRSCNGTILTSGVQALDDVAGLVDAVRKFSTFTEDNDPYGEHDFGVIDKLEWPKVFWKIDYYDKKLEYWCDPLSPECKRILTIMLATEY